MVKFLIMLFKVMKFLIPFMVVGIMLQVGFPVPVIISLFIIYYGIRYFIRMWSCMFRSYILELRKKQEIKQEEYKFDDILRGMNTGYSKRY